MVDMTNRALTYEDRLRAFDEFPPIANFFEIAKHVPTLPSPSPSPSPNQSQYDALIRAKKNEAMRIIDATHNINYGSIPEELMHQQLEEGDELLLYIGDYFTKTAQICGQMLDGVLNCQDVKEATARVHARAEEHEHDYMTGITRMETKISRLLKMRDVTANFARDIQEIWEPSIRSDENSNRLAPFLGSTYRDLMTIGKLIPEESPELALQTKPQALEAPPEEPQQQKKSQEQQPQQQPQQPQQLQQLQQSQQSQQSQQPTRQMRPRTAQPREPKTPKPDHGSPQDEESDSDSSEEENDGGDEEEEDVFAKIDMEALKSRGKGNHTCPKGKKCTKGGIDKDGELIVFDRNSAFVQHCNKHRKPYHCDLDGCPNQPKKRRFARRDGLERHQRSVPHLTTPLQTSS